MEFHCGSPHLSICSQAVKSFNSQGYFWCFRRILQNKIDFFLGMHFYILSICIKMQPRKQNESLWMTYESISLYNAVTNLLSTLEGSAFIDRILVTSSLLLRLKGDAWIFFTNSLQPHSLHVYFLDSVLSYSVFISLWGAYLPFRMCFSSLTLSRTCMRRWRTDLPSFSRWHQHPWRVSQKVSWEQMGQWFLVLGSVFLFLDIATRKVTSFYYFQRCHGLVFFVSLHSTWHHAESCHTGTPSVAQQTLMACCIN